ncbi:MAG: APC family permease [Desulfovibrionales bacterium]|nr:APC family permease [Desulfovibrionales bacterium]
MSESAELKKALRPTDVFAIAVGSIIGFGCFVLPGDWLLESGPLGFSIAFILGALMIIVIGKSYGFMINEYPVAGGGFAFAYKGFGRTQAYICGWMLTLGYLSVVALNATAIPIIIRFIAPTLLTRGYLYSVVGWDVYAAEILVSVSAVLLFAYLNYKGSDAMGKIQTFMVGLLFAAVILLALGSFMLSGAPVSNLYPLFAPNKTAFASVVSILAVAPTAYLGFDTIPHAAEEFDFAPSEAFKLIVLAILSGGAIYIIVALGTAMPYPWLDIINKDMVWATGDAMKAAMGTFGLLFLVVGVLMGICTGMNGFYMATSRLLLSMARAKVLPNWFAKIHPTYQTPVNSILFTMVFGLLLPWFGRTAILWIIDMCTIGTAVSFFYTCFTSYKMIKEANPQSREATIHLVGASFSLLFLGLLCIPGSPAFMVIESWVCLISWLSLGLVFYLAKAKSYRAVPKRELDMLILNKA